MRTNDTEYKMRNTTFFSKNKKYPVDSSKFFTKNSRSFHIH